MVKLEFELGFILFQIPKIWFRKAEMGGTDIYRLATLVEQKLAYFEFDGTDVPSDSGLAAKFIHAFP